MRKVYKNNVLSRVKGVETHPETNPPTIQVLVSNGRTVRLLAEQIPMFLHSGVKSGAIGKELAGKIVSDFKNLIPMVAVNDVTTQEQLDNVYSELDKAIKTKLLASQKSGKKLLVVVGEDHYEKRSSLAESMIINIAKDLGVDNLIMETNPQLLKVIKSSPIDTITTPNFSATLKVAEARGMTLHHGDPEQDNRMLAVRKEAMNKAISSVDGNSVMIVGVLHLPDILEDVTLQSQYEILAINASCIEPKKQAQLYRYGSYPKDALEYALSSDNALQISFPGNPYKLSHAEMLEMSFVAREHVTGVRESKSEIEVTSKTPSVKPLLSVVASLKKSPGMTMEMVTKPLSEKERTMMERTEHPVIKAFNNERMLVDAIMLSNELEQFQRIDKTKDKSVMSKEFQEDVRSSKQSFVKDSSEALSRLNVRLEEYPGDVEARLYRASLLSGNGDYENAAIDAGYVLKKYPANIVAQKLMKSIKPHLPQEEEKEVKTKITESRSRVGISKDDSGVTKSLRDRTYAKPIETDGLLSSLTKYFMSMVVQGMLHISHLLYGEDKESQLDVRSSKQSSSEALSRLNARLKEYPGDVETRLDRASLLSGNGDYETAQYTSA